jgi:3-hydroxybutyryl-CoA dehydrogenase
MDTTARTVGVLGTGTMGAGIVQVVAQAGYDVVACDRSRPSKERSSTSGTALAASLEKASSQRTKRGPPTTASTGR